ncbi:MAG: hypothetical protein WDN00_00005 [Limisphaerales bacterium]
MIEKNGWNSAQLTGRISHYESLPQDLSEADLIGVAKSVLPEADPNVLKALAIYARPLRVIWPPLIRFQNVRVISPS